MKTLIRLWKMFYRLLRLKDYQRHAMLSRAEMVADMRLKYLRDAYDTIFDDYRSYKNLALEYGCNSASELQATIESLYKTKKSQKQSNTRKEKTMKATKKPVTIECFKYDGDLKNSNGEYYVPEWAVEAEKNGIIFFKYQGEMYIKTLEGDHHASVGDYIIRGVNGELYPCKPDIFEKTYDIAENVKQVECVPDKNKNLAKEDEALCQHPNLRIRKNSDVVIELAIERKETSVLLAKLNTAIDADPETVSAHHKELWRKQAKAMQDYVDVLGERIIDLINNN
ncbi:MAG: hypothetical protein J6U20_10020 [Fibrobacter sp.]|nr:hypothetical protein [Fibrobacter sp.]